MIWIPENLAPTLAQFLWDGYHYRKEYFDFAYEIAREFDLLPEYASIHLRGGDRKEYSLAKTAIKRYFESLPSGTAIYVASDDFGSFTEVLAEFNLQIISWKDVEEKFGVILSSYFVSIMDQIMCIQSSYFLGSKGSTFSTHISDYHRQRNKIELVCRNFISPACYRK